MCRSGQTVRAVGDLMTAAFIEATENLIAMAADTLYLGRE